MASLDVSPRQKHRLKTAGLFAGLFVLVILAAGFAVSVVQIQSSIAAYIGGQSLWSSAQLNTISHLDRYARTGDMAELHEARRWLAIPLGDLSARQAMEADPLDHMQARDGLLAGGNHPDDIAGMIWLFHYFADIGAFQQAVDAWRDTDPYLLELRRIANALETERSSKQPDIARIASIRAQLEAFNKPLQDNTRRFRMAMGKAARWATTTLSLTSIAFLVILAILAWLLGSRLVHILRSSEQKFRAIFEQTAVGIVQIDTAGRVLDANEAAGEILELKGKLVASRFEDWVHPEDWLMSMPTHQALIQGESDSYTVEQRMQKGNGDLLWARLTVSLVNHPSQPEPYFIVMMEDISESRRLASELSFQATHDELTGLLNRREFEHRLAATLGRARKYHSHHALCFIDLDQFKVVNDTSGHAAGDQLLRQIAQLAARTLRDGDILARLGGDEFGLILENCNMDTARVVTEKLRRALETIVFTWEGDHHSIGASIGVVPVTTEAPDISELLRSVDIACYMAKEGGRNRVYVSSSDDQQQRVQRGEMAWLTRIQSALMEHRFYLDAQHIVPAHPVNEGQRYEVLIRLLNEEGNVVPPSAFLPAAERFGIINKLDRWVITEVIQKLAAAPDHLKTLEACHINLSGRSFDQPDFADFVVDQITRHDVPGKKLCFEITETAAVQNLLDVQSFMKRLSGLGCTFALDDFGTGLSSFNYLRQLPVDCLKIDGIFVRDIAKNTTNLAMVRAIHDIGRTLGKLTIAEFVEDDASASHLRDIGVDYLQGFGLHRPCHFSDLLRTVPESTQTVSVASKKQT